MLDHNLVLKCNELYSVGDISTDGSGERATGLYLRDTRHLSRFSVSLNGARPETLSVRQHGAARAIVTSANPLLVLGPSDVILPQQIALTEHVSLDDRLHVRFDVHNFSRRSVRLELAMEFSSDFRDLFDIRGFARSERGVVKRPTMHDAEIGLSYVGIDHAAVQTAILFDREPDHVALLAPRHIHPEGLVTLLPGKDDVVWRDDHMPIPVVRASFSIALDVGEQWSMAVAVAPCPAQTDESARSCVTLPAQARITTDNVYFNAALERAASDFEELETTFPEGALPAAGIPWYVAPFGRDSLITGLQTLHLAPERAAGTLRVLAALQGRTVDRAREEEPGKILHEMRYGEMARLREVPHTPYYGSIDATPLWIWLFAETAIWTSDAQFYAELAPNARRAIAWIEQYGDLDGDGFVEYRGDAKGKGGIANQVWKDSFDSLNHPDGGHVEGPIAAVEVQGYVYAAYARLAAAARAFGDDEWADALDRTAADVQTRVEDAFWMESEGFYAQALDGRKEPVRALSSNPGHLLLTGLSSPGRVRAMTERFHAADFDSGWGLRTLSTSMATYNPMSYHNGSVWPHDNSLIGAGLYANGEAEAGHAIAKALFDAARADPLNRLPELYCGFERTGEIDDKPVNYPVSCSPQAWAAGSLPLLTRAMLGLEVDPAARTLVVRPSLPDWLSFVEIRDLRVLGRTGALVVRSDGNQTDVMAEGLPIRVAEPPERAATSR